MPKSNPDTEQESLYSNLEKMSTNELLLNINNEDKKVAYVIEKQIPEIEKLVDVIASKMKLGGRLFYIGAGTSGRVGILDAFECPPTFGVPHDWIIGIIAGGDTAIRKAVENAEDDVNQAWKDLSAHDISTLDVVIGIAVLTTDWINAFANGVQINDPVRISALEQISGIVNPIIWEVRRERRIEFMSWTTLRQMDIFRWKKGDYLDTTKNPDVNLGARVGTPVGTQIKVNANGYVLIYPTSTRNFEAKHYLFNVPTNDIDLYKAQGVELKQNPGW